MEGHPESEPKRQKIEESSSNTFWSWYLPHSQHPKKPAAEFKQTWFRFDSTWRLYNTLVKRKWHNRWYLIEVMKLSPYEMYTFELLRGQGAFQTPNCHRVKIVEDEFWLPAKQ